MVPAMRARRDVTKRLLPAFCQPGRRLRGSLVVVHYFSAIYVDPARAFDMDRCWQLFHDLNLSAADRVFTFTGLGAQRSFASAHYLIGREGEVWQLVPPEWQAWHAGKSRFRGRENCNEFSWGMEFVASHESGFTDPQLRAGAEIAADLLHRSDEEFAPGKHIVGHEHVSGPSVRPDPKKDPGPKFPWEDFRRMVWEEQ